MDISDTSKSTKKKGRDENNNLPQGQKEPDIPQGRKRKFREIDEAPHSSTKRTKHDSRSHSETKKERRTLPQKSEMPQQKRNGKDKSSMKHKLSPKPVPYRTTDKPKSKRPNQHSSNSRISARNGAVHASSPSSATSTARKLVKQAKRTSVQKPTPSKPVVSHFAIIIIHFRCSVKFTTVFEK